VPFIDISAINAVMWNCTKHRGILFMLEDLVWTLSTPKSNILAVNFAL
jgi:hypothetical protein